MRCDRLVLFLSLCASFTLPTLAGDWPQWRGPKRDGVSTETGLLKKWPAAGPPLLWRATGLGAGYSGVAVVGGRIFTCGDKGEASAVLAFEEKTGKPLWSARLGRPGGGGGYPGPRCTPTVDGGLVYALGQHGDLVCVEATSGKEVWRKNLSKDFGGRMMSGWGYAESPLVDGPKVVVTPGGSKGAIVALDKKTGEVLWQSQEVTDAATYASLVPAEIGGVRQYVQLLHVGDKQGCVVGVAAADGRLLWRGPRPSETAVIPTPTVSGNRVFVTSSYSVGCCNLFQISKTGDGFKASEIYSNKNLVNHHGGVVLVNGHLYGHSESQGRAWVCLEFQTGRTVWSDKSVGKGSVLYADGHLYLRSEGDKGTLALVEATPSGYKEKSRFDQPDRTRLRSWPHPVIANGALYIRDQDLLLCYDVKAKWPSGYEPQVD